MRLLLGACIGAAALVIVFTITNSPTGRRVQRWIWYTDARHTHPYLYTWSTLA